MTWIFGVQAHHNIVNNFRQIIIFVELHPESVFFGWWYFSVGIGRYISVIGNYHTDTEGKLGQYFRYQ